MTDRPVDPRTGEALDPTDPRRTDPRYADPRRPAQGLADDRPRVVHEDGTIETLGADGEPALPPGYRPFDEGVPVDERTGPRAGRRPVTERGVEHRDGVAYVPDPVLVREREEDAMGGIKWGSAFFGWLAAMGVAALLTALLAAAGTALALNNQQAADAVDSATSDPGTASTIGLWGAAAVLVVMFVAYVAGGYVAGRMARIDGPRQGLGVWLWMIVAAVVAAIVATVAGSAYDVLGRLNTYPRIPLDVSQLAAAGVVTLVLALAVSLLGAVLGGAAGMAYHRRMDAVGLGTDEVAVR